MDLRETCSVDVKAQARVDSDLALGKWADNDERKELLPRPLLEPVVANKKRPRSERDAQWEAMAPRDV